MLLSDYFNLAVERSQDGSTDFRMFESDAETSKGIHNYGKTKAEIGEESQNEFYLKLPRFQEKGGF